ncbi:MAG: single-stranded DNA-binding protein [Erysipelotrichaceae bacterium]|jgi:single-strand DNA-binding protein|nr:single-stranded DNA-binding protein [Erysipelotrichaceae bacterium]
MMNNVVLVGRITRDLELRTATSGRSIVSFTLAVDSRMKNADGSRATSFIDCVAFGQTAETMSKFTRKGSLIGVVGSLNQRKYQRKDGSTASVLEVLCDSVQFLEPKGSRAGGRDEIPPFDDIPSQPEEDDNSHNLDSIDLPDDDLPF